MSSIEERIYSVMEKTAAAVARLDARISVVPWPEAWQIRATFYAATKLSAVDGTPVDPGDILSLMMGSTMTPEHYWPASVGFAHWRRCISRIEFSRVTDRLLGRSLTKSEQAEEDQFDMDWEDSLSPAVRRALSRHAEQIDDVDRYAREVVERALVQMRSTNSSRSTYRNFADGLRLAALLDYDEEYFARTARLRNGLNDDIDRAYGVLDSGCSPEAAAEAKRFQNTVKWARRPHLGACFSVVPDRLIEVKLTDNRLSCLTAATKRLGQEYKGDDRAFIGVLHQLKYDAEVGLNLLDDLEDYVARVGKAKLPRNDPRSSLPLVLYAFLAMPAIGSSWLQRALQIKETAVLKHIKTLSKAGLIEPWSKPVKIGSGPSEQLWSAVGLSESFKRAAMPRPGRSRVGARPLPSPAEMLADSRSVDLSIPMAIVYDRHAEELIDLDKLYGRFFDENWLKNRSARKLTESQNEA